MGCLGQTRLHEEYGFYFLGLTAQPATMRALPPVGVQRRVLQLGVKGAQCDSLLAHHSGLSVAEDSGATDEKATTSTHIWKQPGHFTSIK